VLPPRATIPATEALLAQFAAEQATLVAQIEEQREVTRTLELELSALRQTAYLADLLQRRQKELDDAVTKLAALSQRYADVAETHEASAEYLNRLRAGDIGSPRAHIRRAHAPQPPIAPQSRFTQWWAAVSGGLLLLIVVGLVFLRPPTWPLWLVGVAVAFGAVEAAAQGRLRGYLYGLTIALAIFNAAILLYEFWPVAIILVVVGLVVLMIRDNLREVFGG
jgi:hypothetical protein